MILAFGATAACSGSPSSGGGATSSVGGTSSSVGGTTSSAGGTSSSSGGAKSSVGGATSSSGGAGGTDACTTLPTTDAGAPPTGTITASEPVSPYIVVDQFGYRTGDEKIAIARNPKVGFDANNSFTPGSKYAVVDAHTGTKLLEAAPTAWNGGATDSSSGDQVWTFDFSTVSTQGEYFILDETNAVRSNVFMIWDHVYRDVLVQSTRMYYYQRDGIAKPATFAGTSWADTMEHAQDATCGLYSDGSKPIDLRGGWFDAGDQNTYTNWHAADVVQLLHAYVEAPSAFGDDTNIPESGNGVADILDEVKWELDWMLRAQQSDGSVIPIKGHTGASPPSADTKPCLYGPPTTSASFSAAEALSYASTVLKKATNFGCAYPGYADKLATQAESAWAWAVANPNVTFRNTDHGLGGGEQEADASGLVLKHAEAAAYLFEATGKSTYHTYFDANYNALLTSFDSSHLESMDAALEYALLPSATSSVKTAILTAYETGAQSTFVTPVQQNEDPYGSWVPGYWWGSNQTKSGQGCFLGELATNPTIDTTVTTADALKYAERYVHYMHGLNPLGIVYLTAMGGHGAEKFATRMWHSWFKHGSDWDQAGVSKYGPPPGYITGGPNPSYSWDGCCPGGCSGLSCGAAVLSPPANQPGPKAYLDFNDDWPLDAWSVTEPDVGYQAQWVRLLSKFVQ